MFNEITVEFKKWQQAHDQEQRENKPYIVSVSGLTQEDNLIILEELINNKHKVGKVVCELHDKNERLAESFAAGLLLTIVMFSIPTLPIISNSCIDSTDFKMRSRMG